MFGMQHRFKQLSGGIAVAAFVAVVAVPSALSMTFITDTLGGNGSPKAAPDAFERAVAIHSAKQAQQAQGVTLITDTLGGNGSPKTDLFERSTAIREAQHAMSQARAVAQGYVDQTTVRVYNPGAYVRGGASPAVAKATQALGYGSTPASSATGQPGGKGFNWSYAGIGAGLAAGLLLLLLLGGQRPRQHRRSVRTA
jgi:hypothetical protein